MKVVLFDARTARINQLWPKRCKDRTGILTAMRAAQGTFSDLRNHTSNRFGHAKSSTNPTSSSFKRRQWPGRTSRRWYHWHRMCHISWFTHQVHRPECACQHGSASLHPIPTLYLQTLHMRNTRGLCFKHLSQGFRLRFASMSGGSPGVTSNGEVNQVFSSPPLHAWLTLFMKQFSIVFYTKSCACWSLNKVLQLLVNN